MSDPLKEPYEAYAAWERAWMEAHPDDTHTIYELVDIYWAEGMAALKAQEGDQEHTTAET